MMDRRFDMANFEQSLKDHADQFSIVPSKRVWRGIYNDFHPGSKWPSIAMALVFFFTLVGIGHLNNTPKRTTDSDQPTRKIESVTPPGNKVASSEPYRSGKVSPAISNKNKKDQSEVDAGLVVENTMSDNAEMTLINSANQQIPKYSPKVSVTTISVTAKAHPFERVNTIDRITGGKRLANFGDEKTLSNIEKLSENNSIAFSVPMNKNIVVNKELDSHPLEDWFTNDNNKVYATGIIENKILLPEIFFFNDRVSMSAIPLIANFKEQENSIENNEGMNAGNATIKTHKKRNEKVNWFYYLTPTITSVYFTGEAIQQTTASNFSPIVIQSNQHGNNMIYNARLGFETGTEMIYTFGKAWSLITGAHVSYSGYNVISDQVHPTFGSLLLRNSSGNTYSKSYITQYGNGEGQSQLSLKNYNLQVSIPVGLQYAVWGNKNLQISLASTIEPSFVVKSNAYLLTSNGKNYVNDPNLMRKVNLSGNFGSYVSFYSNKIKWRVGPSVRYQVLSSYQNIYPVKEHLIDYGIRIGISR
ncbi:MAG: hypothetical protein ABIR03_14840 [Ginsengibacter sp.]